MPSYGLEIKRSNGVIINNNLTKGGRIFLEKVEVVGTGTAGTTTTKTYTAVSSGSYLKVIPLSVTRPVHDIVASTNGSGQATLTFTERSLNPNYSGSRTTTVLVFTTYNTETLTSDYGLSCINDSGERTISAVYPSISFLGKLTANTISHSSFLSQSVGAVGYYMYNHHLNVDSTFTIQPNQQCMILWSIPSYSTEVWFYPGGIDPVDLEADPNLETSYFLNGSNSLTYSGGSEWMSDFAIWRHPSTSMTNYPEAFVFAVDNLAPSSEQYGLRIKDASGKVTFDSGLNHGNIIGYETSLNLATSNFTASSFSGITPAFNIPTLNRWQGVKNGSSYDLQTTATFLRRNNTTLYSRTVLIGIQAAAGLTSWSYTSAPVGSIDGVNYNQVGNYLTQIVIDSAQYGGTAF